MNVQRFDQKWKFQISLNTLLTFINKMLHFQEIILPRKFRTVTNGIPVATPKKQQNGTNGNSGENGTNGKDKEKEPPPVGSLLARQALHTYETANHIVHYKYSAYGGACSELPK